MDGTHLNTTGSKILSKKLNTMIKTPEWRLIKTWFLQVFSACFFTTQYISVNSGKQGWALPKHKSVSGCYKFNWILIPHFLNFNLASYSVFRNPASPSFIPNALYAPHCKHPYQPTTESRLVVTSPSITHFHSRVIGHTWHTKKEELPESNSS